MVVVEVVRVGGRTLVVVEEVRKSMVSVTEKIGGTKRGF